MVFLFNFFLSEEKLVHHLCLPRKRLACNARSLKGTVSPGSQAQRVRAQPQMSDTWKQRFKKEIGCSPCSETHVKQSVIENRGEGVGGGVEYSIPWPLHRSPKTTTYRNRKCLWKWRPSQWENNDNWSRVCYSQGVSHLGSKAGRRVGMLYIDKRRL